MKLNTIHLAHHWLEQFIKAGDLCVDATAGRGFDTLFLCQRTGENGKVIAFDIQKEAIESTKERLITHNVKADLYQMSHVHMTDYVKPNTVAGMIFNFGYLPGGDHRIATQKDTSIQAIEEGLRLLKVKGAMALCIYHGGDTGFEEKEAIMAYLKTIDDKQYTVIVTEFYNRPHHPPIFVGIVREQ